jgi:TRAP-type C4-dicarboxylate transport system substrate-binding protein
MAALRFDAVSGRRNEVWYIIQNSNAVAATLKIKAAEREDDMAISRRHMLVGAVAAPAVIAASRFGSAAPAQALKISHQFPGGTIDDGDFRDRICLKFAAELEKRTNGALGGQVYPNSSLMKTIPQFSAVRKGALDLSFYPISYAGGEFPELNIGLMPGLVSSYQQGAAWKTSPVGQKFGEFLAGKGVLILSWIWQAGGVVSRGNPIINPDDAKGLKIRGGSREMDMMLQKAGATTLSTPSNELYQAMQTGACDAAITSSTSLISFRLEEVAKSLTTGRGKSYWYMLEPLIMSKDIFDKLSRSQQEVILALGAELEQFGTNEAMADDRKVAEVYAKKGAKVADLDDAIVEKWRAIARVTAWKDYADRTPLSADLLKLAEAISV